MSFFKRENKLWFMDEIHRSEQDQRIREMFRIQEYLLREHRKHDILMRLDTEFKDGTFTIGKMVFQAIKSVVEGHTSYVVGRQVSISGEPGIVADFNQIYKKGRYPKADYELISDLYKYGNAFDYAFLDGDTIRSRVIPNEIAFPVYDENYNYISFVEHWKDLYFGGDDHYTVYYPDRVETYLNRNLVETKPNLTGLPIHYVSLDKTDAFGNGLVAGLIPVMDNIEEIVS